ncbi:hypothetical protein CRM22_009857 [Opisthorchis felineus]|uniref:GPN-loop GTPase 2 n=1 Tax=Opisthorchis felineus TaxID=147828 RepID=A0A4S2L4C6_OPIFE|nr:hypothetical protein CRM22_009857 [Opisthorchis felineus]
MLVGLIVFYTAVLYIPYLLLYKLVFFFQFARVPQNFLALCASDYYKGCIFHRNIKGFIVQTGDPTGTGKNGQSIWKKKFKDEFHESLRHNARGIVSMANNGPDSNGSQFFITYSKQTMLDMKYSIFAKVIDGWNVLDELERAPVEEKTYRPLTDIHIQDVTTHANPFADSFDELFPEPNQGAFFDWMAFGTSSISRGGLGLFGQLVIGPPGSGKTTYCAAMADFLTNLERKVHVVNLDPANDTLPYCCSVDLSDLIRLEEVMDYLSLGPNGGLIYCMEYLYTNRDWLADRLSKLKQKDPKCYLIFDCPGQVELYTHHPVTRQLIAYLTQKTHQIPGGKDESATIVEGLGLQLTAVHLVDSHYCSDPGKFISCLLTSLSTMLQLSLPHVNILSKADLIEQFGELEFNLDYFTEVLDLQYLVDKINKNNDPFLAKYERLNQALISIIQDQSLVQFLLLDIQNMSHLERVMRYADRANGYVFGPDEQRNLQALMHSASGVELTPDWIGLAQEKYMSGVKQTEPDIDFFS